MKAGLIALTWGIVACATSCTTSTQISSAEEAATFVVNDKALRSDFGKKMAELIKVGTYTSQATLRDQLARTSCQLELPATGTTRMGPAELYRLRLDSTLLLGKFYLCGSESCEKIHTNIASGVVIHEDGVVLTNYHVVNDNDPRRLGMGVMTRDGQAFLIDEVLAADKASDVAILKLKDAKGLTAAPIFRDEPVGNPVTIISHPTGRFYTLSHGRVSRYYINNEDVSIMNVTADYAKGSSGGPIFNDRGDVVGLVANTVSIAYKHVPLHVDEKSKALEIASKRKKPHMLSGKPLTIGTNHQMTVKNTVPSRAILNLIQN